MSENTTDQRFKCGGCEYSTTELREGMSHAASTNHDLTRAADDEGTTMTISVAFDDDLVDDDEDDWDEAGQW